MTAGAGGNVRPHVRFCTPSYSGVPCEQYFESLARTLRLLEDNGFAASVAMVRGDCYVQRARNNLVADAMAAGADYIFFLDDDMGWDASAALKLLLLPDPVVFGAYPFKDKPGFPVVIHTDARGYPRVRADGCIAAAGAPTGFLRIARGAIKKLQAAHPEREYDEHDDTTGAFTRSVFDLFPQGVARRRWWGEDFGFCNLWTDLGGEIWLWPDIDFEHVARDGKVTRGNYHEYLKAQPRHDAAA